MNIILLNLISVEFSSFYSCRSVCTLSIIIESVGLPQSGIRTNYSTRTVGRLGW